MSQPEQVFTDPRTLPPEVLGFNPALIEEVALPCGQTACTPLLNNCQQIGTDPNQAVVLAGRQMGYEERTRQVEIERQLTDKLAIDRNTGIFTYNAIQVLFERMVSTGLLAEMRFKGYTLETLVGDVDVLKIHNALGDHQGGDAALFGVVDRIRPLFRRKGDVVARPAAALGVIRHERQVRQAVATGQSASQLGRFDKGDELIGMGFLAPSKEDSIDRRRPLISLDARATQITDVLRGARITYPLQSLKSAEELRAEYGDRLNFTIRNGMVDAHLSATFAIARSHIPHTIDGFYRLFESINHAMNNAKRERVTVATRVVTLNLLAIE